MKDEYLFSFFLCLNTRLYSLSHSQLPMFPESPHPDGRWREEGLMVVGSLRVCGLCF